MQYVKRAIPVTAFQWIEGTPWVEGMTQFAGAPVCETKNGPVPVNSGDWIMQGEGEYYPCPDEVFRKTYLAYKTSGMSFGQALDAMKVGNKVARSGWNGKGMWVALSGTGDGPNGGRITQAEGFWNPHSRAFAEGNGGSAEVLPTVIMKTAGDQILMGWLASQSDMVAEDWEIVRN